MVTSFHRGYDLTPDLILRVLWGFIEFLGRGCEMNSESRFDPSASLFLAAVPEYGLQFKATKILVYARH